MIVTMNLKVLVCKYQSKTSRDRLFNCVLFLLFCSPLSIGASAEMHIDVDHCDNVTNLEHVQANVSLSFHRRGDVKITLISPAGTPSELISYRDNDASKNGMYPKVIFMTKYKKFSKNILKEVQGKHSY